MSLVSERVTFDALCAVWPMRSEAERVDSLRLFEAVAPHQRAEFVRKADAYRAFNEFCPDLDLAGALPEAAATAAFCWALSLASVESGVRALMKGSA